MAILKWGSVLMLAAAGMFLLPVSQYLWGAVLFIPLVLLSFIDLKSFRLPDTLTLPLIVAGLLFSFLKLPYFPDITHSLLGAATGYLFIFLVAAFYRRFRGREGIGMGDAKLLAAGGAWLGVLFIPFILLIASTTGLLIALVCMRGTTTLQTAIPFGPFLAVGIWLAWLLKVSSIIVLHISSG